jgi:hypothetical protein
MRGREAEWTYRLSPPEVVEIETAIKAVQARGLDIVDIRREDFPLPTLGPVLDRLRAEVLEGRGFALLRGMPVEELVRGAHGQHRVLGRRPFSDDGVADRQKFEIGNRSRHAKAGRVHAPADRE